MDIINTHFEFVPIEIMYLISYNLSMKDILNFLGLNLCITNRLFFNNIIKRDFGQDILTNLIDMESVKKKLPMIMISMKIDKLSYDEFLLGYRETLSRIQQNQNIILDKNFYCKFSDFDKIGIPETLIVNKVSGVSLKSNDYDVGIYVTIFNIINKKLTLGIRGYGIYYVTNTLSISSISNLLFFYNHTKIFVIK